MATESELRDLLQGPEPEGRTAIDLDAVLTRARRRRRPKLLAVQALGSVAVVGGLFAAVVATLPPQQQAASILAEDTAGGSGFSMPESADENELRKADALSLNACGEPVSELVTFDAPSVTVEPLTAVSGTDPLPVTVTLRGAPMGEASGTTSEPVLTVTRDGVVVAHPDLRGNVGYEVALPADGTFVYEMSLSPVQCGGDSAAPTALPPGDYEVWAAVDFYGLAGDGSSTLIVGPPTPLTIR